MLPITIHYNFFIGFIYLNKLIERIVADDDEDSIFYKARA